MLGGGLELSFEYKFWPTEYKIRGALNLLDQKIKNTSSACPSIMNAKFFKASLSGGFQRPKAALCFRIPLK